MANSFYPATLGMLMMSIRTRFGNLSKYRIANASDRRRPLNHALIQRIESGQRIAPDYDTILRIADAIDRAHETENLSREDRVSLFEAAFADRITYETAKFAVYYLFMLDGSVEPLHPALEKLRLLMLDALPEMGEDTPGSPAAPRRGIGRTATRGVRHEATNLRTATGFDAVRLMAEKMEAHHLRLHLLVDVIPWLNLDWEYDELLIGSGTLRPQASARSVGTPRNRRVERNGTSECRIVQLWPRHEDESL